jgi:4-hydroxybenzoate polyprenyltransferase
VKPDGIQTLWLVRGTLYAAIGLLALIGTFLFGDWRISLLIALFGIASGATDIWLALSSMADDERRGLNAPDRVESAEHGLRAAGWNSREPFDEKP